MYKAKVNVTLKKSVLDPQGKTVMHTLSTLGFNDVKDIRVGKYFEVNLEAKDNADAEKKLKSICDKVLINPVIEDYTYEFAAL